ncbi:4Fe-4S dicluster domain-containing protein [Neobacillus muris]|uniref:4Fe-4S dicluster domain-containing protein n=1 Tax=Neobacillus muris TaxID=2941334 RepID=UPI00203F4F70|nr:4Fe-4S dicluster domain-containing protein [Neobacillus muris]
MGFLGKWVESLDYQYNITDACLMHRSPRASCTACVESCNYDALTFKNQKPVINSEKCVECGHCIAACPVQAIEGIIPKRNLSGNRLAADDASVPSLKELLVYHAKGITSIIASKGELSQAWKDQVCTVNSMLQQLDKNPFQVKVEEGFSEEMSSCTRRDLFSLLGKEGTSLVKQVTPAKWRFNHKSLDLSAYYPEYQFYELDVKLEKCSMCKACETLCPKQCFQITAQSFRIESQTCSGCQLCSRICPENAITVTDHISRAVTQTFDVYTKVCKVCKSSYQTCKPNYERCPVCARRKSGYLDSNVC